MSVLLWLAWNVRCPPSTMKYFRHHSPAPSLPSRRVSSTHRDMVLGNVLEVTASHRSTERGLVHGSAR
ncbi:unnamed protein product, partial [Ectocarpus sp. 8 AP-2014]